jgi:MFS family permease
MRAQTASPVRAGGEWWLLAGASLILAFSAVGFLVQTFGVFSAAIEQEFGWSRTETYGILTIATLLAPALIPATGWAADRLNLRVLVVSALVVEVVSLLALGLLPVGRIGFSVMFLVTYAASFGASAVPLAKAVGTAFSHRRGAALGLLFAGACLGAIANPLIAGALIAALGWQGAFAVLGVQTAVLAALPALLFLRPDRPRTPSIGTARPAGWRALFRTRALYAILGWGFFAALGYGGMQGHLVPLLEERAHTATEAVIGQSLLGVGLLVGNLAAGLLLDRIPTRPLASLMLAIPVAALLALAVLPSGPSDIAITTGIGVATGTETAMLAYVVSHYLPHAVSGRALSIGLVAVALGGGVSTLIGAATHDATGDYRLFLVLCAGFLAVAAVWPWGLRARAAEEPSLPASAAAGEAAR